MTIEIIEDKGKTTLGGIRRYESKMYIKYQIKVPQEALVNCQVISKIDGESQDQLP